MYNGTVPVQMSGKRKPTTIRCNVCSEAEGRTVWHDTPRGVEPSGCPRGGFAVERPVGHSAVRAPQVAPALVREVGTPPQVRDWQVAKLGGER